MGFIETNRNHPLPWQCGLYPLCCEIIVTTDLYLPKDSNPHRHSTHMISVGCLLLFFKSFFLHSKAVFPKKRVTTLSCIMIFGMILQMWKRKRASCPSSVCFLDLKGLWSGSSLENLLRDMAKSFPSLSSGNPPLPGGRVAWSTSPEKTAGASGDELGLVKMTTAIRAQEPSLTTSVYWVDSVLGQSAPELTSPVLTGKTLLTLTLIS